MEALTNILEDQKEISFSKTKLLLYFLGCMVFVVTGVWFVVFTPITERSFIFRFPIMIAAVGWAVIIVFGVFAIMCFCKLFDKKPAFTVSKTGLTANSSGMAIGIGEIPWSDVTEITVYDDPKNCETRTKWICLIVQNPEHYIDQQSNSKRRSVMVSTLKVCGTPIAITHVWLNVSFDELLKIVNEYYAASKQ